MMKTNVWWPTLHYVYRCFEEGVEAKSPGTSTTTAGTDAVEWKQIGLRGNGHQLGRLYQLCREGIALLGDVRVE